MEQNLKALPVDVFIRYAKHSVLLLIVILAIAGAVSYTGQLHVYIAFTVVANVLLFMGFGKKAIFFDTFIGLFFWLGFWLKLTIRVCFADSVFHEAVGDFDGTGIAFDHALWVATIGMAGLIAASIVRAKFFFNFPTQFAAYEHDGMLAFYQTYRKYVLIAFVGGLHGGRADQSLLGYLPKRGNHSNDTAARLKWYLQMVAAVWPSFDFCRDIAMRADIKKRNILSDTCALSNRKLYQQCLDVEQRHDFECECTVDRRIREHEKKSGSRFAPFCGDCLADVCLLIC